MYYVLVVFITFMVNTLPCQADKLNLHQQFYLDHQLIFRFLSVTCHTSVFSYFNYIRLLLLFYDIWGIWGCLLNLGCRLWNDPLYRSQLSVILLLISPLDVILNNYNVVFCSYPTSLVYCKTLFWLIVALVAIERFADCKAESNTNMLLFGVIMEINIIIWCNCKVMLPDPLWKTCWYSVVWLSLMSVSVSWPTG